MKYEIDVILHIASLPYMWFVEMHITNVILVKGLS